MYWKVFPEYAVKQVFHENDIKRNDEHIIGLMQSDLVSRCVHCILKPALIRCISNKRKFINEKDITVGTSLSIFPKKEKPAKAGALLKEIEFQKTIREHIALCLSIISKQCSELAIENEYKISNDTMVVLQLAVESCIRGFVDKLGMNASYKQFEIVMSEIMGDPSYIYSDQEFIPLNL